MMLSSANCKTGSTSTWNTMTEPTGNPLVIDGGQVKEEHIASIKPATDIDSEIQKSKTNLAKSKEKLSADGAEEKLLKDDEAKITIRIDMADAKFVVGDHRNGDAKIELDANKIKFAGLTKEELMKFADDPFWVRLRWFMFIMFWVLWLAMLAGAIAIIVCAPKCSPPAPLTWYQKGPIIDTTPELLSEVAQKQHLLPNIQRIGAKGLLVAQDEPYKVLDDEKALDDIKSMVNRAKEYSIKVIVELSASFVLSDHKWFQLAVNRTGEYANYFIWANGTDFDETGRPKPPNNWVSKVNTAAWSWSDARRQFYYHQYAENKPQLDFSNPTVVKLFDDVIRKYMEAGVAGIRLDARELLVDSSLPNEVILQGSGAVAGSDHTEYTFWRHQHTSDQPALPPLLSHWAHVIDHCAGNTGTKDTVFTITESGGRPELFLLQHNTSFLRPPSAAAINLERNAADVAKELNDRVYRWPLLQLTQGDESNLEVAAFSYLLPAAPLLKPNLFNSKLDNVSQSALDNFARLALLREDGLINYANTNITAISTHNSTAEVLVSARWKSGDTGYAAVWNPSEEQAAADLTVIASVPSKVVLYYASAGTMEQTLYNVSQILDSRKVLVPPKSTVVLSFAPKTTADK